MPSPVFWSTLATALVGFSFAQTPNPTVDGSNFSWIGVRNTTAQFNYDYFYGIPFGKAPVGALRFKPPVAWTPTGSNKVINATAPGTSCEQGIADSEGQVENSSEDCLNLNIWRPSKISGKIPVMVWIYGGGFYFGSTLDYPGDNLVQTAIELNKPVIYVSINYCTGIYGFPPGKEAAAAGALNLGLKDQRLALEWVQKNIAYFGGDRTKVTLFGNSAGAVSTSYQSMYKGGNIGGVFRSMILESGSPSTVKVASPGDPVLESAFTFLVNATNCNDSVNKFECVRNARADVLRQANQDVVAAPNELKGVDQGPVAIGPYHSPGDNFLPRIPSEIVHAGKFARVPFINGGQLDEGTIFVNGQYPNRTEDVINWLISQIPGLYFGINNRTAVEELLKYYSADPAAGSPYNTGNETFGQAAQYKRLTSIIGDLLFHTSRRDHLRTATKFGVNTWSYLFTEVVPLEPEWGVYHTGELDFVFNLVRTKADPPPGLLALEKPVLDYWLSFVYYLDPNVNRVYKDRSYWPKYGSNATAIHFASNITLGRDDFRSKGIGFIINSPSLYQ